MSKIFKRKKLLILLLLVVIFTTIFVSKNRFSFLTSVSKDKYEYNLVEDGEERIKIDNENYAEGVTFDVYFLKDIDNDNYADGVRNTELMYGKSEKLYFDLNASGDYSIKNGKIKFTNNNVKVSGTLAKSSVIPKSLSSTNYTNIDLSEITPGTSSFFYLNVTPYIDKDLKMFNASNQVLFTGTLVNIHTGEEIPFSKNISYDVDSYAKSIETRVGTTTSSNPVNVATITYSIEVMETKNAMPLKASYLTGSVPDFEGRHPTSVRVSSADGANIEYDYDSSNQTFTAVKNAVLNDNNVITRQAYNTMNNGARYNKWYIVVEYPVEEGEVLDNKTTSISLEAWDTGYTNSNLDEKKSNVVKKILSHTFTILPVAEPTFIDNTKIDIGSYINSLNNYFVSKDFLTNVYLGQANGNFTFNERWRFNSHTDKNSELLYTEQGNRFSSSKYLKNFTTYKTMSVSSTPNINNYKIYIYNGENDELIHVIDKTNVNEVFNFPNDIRLIKVKTNEVEKNKTFTMSLSFTKEINTIDMMNNVSLENFLLYGTISNSGYAYETSNGANVSLGVPFNGNASFSNTYSDAKLTSRTTSFTREVSETSIPMSLSIDLNNVDAANNVWSEGFFLIKLPREIIDLEDLTVSPENNVVNSEIVTIDGQKFIKIINKMPSTYNNDITVNFDAIINPKTTECSGYIELYAINNMTTLYYNSVNDTYDINGNGSTTDKAAYSRLGIYITAPKELLTGAIITDYDDLGSQTVSPLVADIDPTRGESDANVNIFLINNSSFKIKGIELLGKIAYEGNTYVGINGNLGSEYDTTMAGPIQVPSSLNGKVTVYYSEKEKPSRDINDSNNGWVTNVSDYSTIKSYLIKIDDSIEMSINDKYDFYYPVDIPNSTDNLLKKSYYNHGVFFKRITDAGIMDASVTAPKLGIRTARKYDLDLDLYKSFTDTKIPGGQYILTDDEGTSKTITIDNNGHALVKDLYVNKEYTLKQYSAYNRYVKDEEEKTFKLTNGENDELVLTKDGKYRSISYSNKVLSIDLENEVLYTLDLHNIDVDSNADIKNTKFKVTGKNHENGAYIYTDNYGHAYLYDMVLGETYVVEQVKIDNYAPITKFNMRIERDPDTHEIKILVEEVPHFTKSTCDSRYNVYDTSVTSDKNSTGSALYECYLEVDLTKYRDLYNVTGYAYMYDYFYGSSYQPTFDVTVVKDEMRNNAPSMLHLWSNNNDNSRYYQSRYGNLNTTKAYKYNNNTFEEVDMLGGSKYYIYVKYKRGYISTDTYAYLNSISIKTPTGKPELIFLDEKENVHPKDYNDVTKTNDNVYQTVKNYSLNDTSNPILEVDVKNKYIEKAYLEINKIDGETDEILTGAQFKVSGPGLPDGGKYVTVDDEGKATVEVYLSYSGNTYYLPGMTSTYPKDNYYTVEEIVPPKGYAKDDKNYSIKLTNYVTYDSNTQVNSFEYRTEYDLYNSTGNNNGNNKFSKVEIDEDTKTWKVTVKDYPIVKVTKVDAETGVVLPNTYYAVYSATRINGTEVLDFAKDSDGNYIGEKIRIDGQDYYIVKTDENGTFTLNLSGGQYQLREIQAADNKYEIDDQIIYFGIGESVPYQAAGMTLTNAYGLDPNHVNERNAKIYPTNDGGYIITSIAGSYSGPMNIVKLDKNGNEVWYKQLFGGYKQEYYYGYFDDPDRLYKYSSGTFTNSSVYHISYKEYDDGYYFATYDLDMYRLDKETGEVLLHNAEDNPSPYIYIFEQYCDIPEGKTINDYSDYLVNPNYTDKVYCYSGDAYVYYNYFGSYGYSQQTSFSDDGYLYAIYQIETTGHYGFLLKDGTKVIPEERTYTTINGNEYRMNDEYLLKFDKEGDIVSATPIEDIIYNAKVNHITNDFPDLDEAWERFKAASDYAEISDYMISKNIVDTNYSNFFKVLDNGDMIYAGTNTVLEYQYKRYSSDSYYYSTNISLPFLIRFDKDLNVKDYRFLGVNGNPLSLYYSSGYEDPYLIINDDGSYDYFYTSSSTLGVDYEADPNNIQHYLLSKPYNIIASDKEEGHPGGYYTLPIYKWDSNGNPLKPIEILRSSRYVDLESTTNDMKRVYQNYWYFNIAPYEDGYIVGSSLSNAGGLYNNSEPYRTVELKSGEIIRLDDKSSFILYKVNADSSIEWVKQYGNIFSNRYGYNKLNMIENKLYMVRMNVGRDWTRLNLGATDGEMITSINDPDYHDLNNDLGNMLLEFELKDEVKAEAPEAYNLTLENKRKEYKVTVTSNDGGSFDVKDENNSILYTGTNPGKIETIKHGDDSKNKLIIKPNTNYGIKSITVNGEKASYIVNDDGNVVLNKFTNVQEDINIDVQFEIGSSRVVVHHYLKDTTTKIDDDELLQGKINDDYETEAKANELYSLVKDGNDEYIIPDNYRGKFTREPIEVIYYYDVNMVELVVNFFKNDTEESVAPSIYSQHLLGYRYAVEALNIPNYKLVNVLGNESGILNRELTEVTYYYDTDDTNTGDEPHVLQGTVTVHHIATDTCRDLVPPITRTLDYNTSYETEVLSDIPSGYRYKSRTDNYFGVVDEEHNAIDVYYYYDRIKSRVTVKYIDSDTNEEIEDRMNIYVNLGERYVTKELVYVPTGYKLLSKPVNAVGTANEERIEVIYKYIKDGSGINGESDNPDNPNRPSNPNNPSNSNSNKGVKGASEKSPKTGDFIGKYFIIGIISIVGILGALLIVKKIKNTK